MMQRGILKKPSTSSAPSTRRVARNGLVVPPSGPGAGSGSSEAPVIRRSVRLASQSPVDAATPPVPRRARAPPPPNVSNLSGTLNAMPTVKSGVTKPAVASASTASTSKTSASTTKQDSNNNQEKIMTNPPNFVNPFAAPPPRQTPSQPIMKNFDAGNCAFCSINLAPQEGVMINSCLHTFCRDCLQAAIETQKDKVRIPCPIADETKCGGYLENFEVEALVSPAIYQEYLDRSLEIAKKKMKNVFNCKTDKCGGWCELADDNRKTFVCPICGETSCMPCGAIHTGMDCASFKSLSDNGQLSKVKEIMDKEKKNGWGQLIHLMRCTGGSGGGGDAAILLKMEHTDLLLNTMTFECPICFNDDVGVGDGVILHECLHMFCKECLVHLVEYNDEPTVKCPYIDGNYSCVCFMQPREIKALVSNEIHEKHLQRSAKLGESSMTNSFHCKTPDCPGWCEYDDGAKRFTCPTCKKNNCIACNAIHNGSCEDYKNSITQNANDKLSLAAVEKLIQDGQAMRCPKCKIPVQKTVGCDWLLCTACRTEICWCTRGPRWGPKGRGDTSGGCKCMLNGKKCHPKCGNCH